MILRKTPSSLLDDEFVNKPGPYGDVLYQYRNRTALHAFFLYDALGSEIMALNGSNNAITSAVYDAYGRVLSGAAFLGWVGRWGYFVELNTGGNIYVRQRAYNGWYAAWLSPDRLGVVDGPNLYQYVGGNPVNFVDPWGLLAEGEVYVQYLGQLSGGSIWNSQMSMSWYPPASWTDINDKSCPCTIVGLYQIADTSEIRSGWSPAYVKHRPWHFDDLRARADVTEWIRGGPIKIGQQATGVGSSPTNAQMRDDPGFFNDPSNLWWKLLSLTQKFETCAICMDTKSGRYLEIFGCVNWGHSVEDQGPKRWTKTLRLGAPYQRTMEINVSVTSGSEVDNSPPGLNGKRTAGAAPSKSFVDIMKKTLGGNVRW
jgi:RHS repeat-associated protein